MTEYRLVRKVVSGDYGDGITVEIPDDAEQIDVEYIEPIEMAGPRLVVKIRYLEPVSNDD